MNNFEYIENLFEKVKQISIKNISGDCFICNSKTVKILKDNHLLKDCLIIPEELKDLQIVGKINDFYVIESDYVEDNTILGYKLDYLTSTFIPSLN